MEDARMDSNRIFRKKNMEPQVNLLEKSQNAIWGIPEDDPQEILEKILVDFGISK